MSARVRGGLVLVESATRTGQRGPSQPSKSWRALLVRAGAAGKEETERPRLQRLAVAGGEDV